MAKKNKKEVLTVVKKSKFQYGDKVIEVTEEDEKKVNRNLFKLEAMGMLIGSHESELAEDFLPVNWIIKDICEETRSLLRKYHLCF